MTPLYLILIDFLAVPSIDTFHLTLLFILCLSFKFKYSKAAFRAAKLVRDTELQKRKDEQPDRPWWQPW